MRALGLTDAANPQIQFVDIPVPAVAAHEVLVQVLAVAVGPHDRRYLPQQASYPLALGASGAGVIAAVGDEVQGLAEGDAVLFTNTPMTKGGAWAEYAVVPADRVAPKPDGLDFVDAAVVAAAGPQAMAGLEHLSLEPGKPVLVTDAAGAAGMLALQIAGEKRCWVLAVAPRKFQNFVRSLGAQAVFSPDNPRWQLQAREFALGGIPGALALAPGSSGLCLQALRDGGTLVVYDDDRPAPERGINIVAIHREAVDARHLAQLAEDVARQRLLVAVDRVFPWDRALEALARAESGEGRGPVVLTLQK